MNEELKRVTKLYYSTVERIQSECKHNNKTMKYGASTGNYDPSCDEYWIDHSCPDCGKYWQTPQGREYE